MLKGISKILTGDLLKALSDMGHGDELVIADANFPAHTYGRRIITCPGIDACTLLREIVKVFPLDGAVEHPAVVLDLIPEDVKKGYKPVVWDGFAEILTEEYGEDTKLYPISRSEFYERTAGAYLVIQTGEERQYGDVLLVKGVIE